MASVNFLELKSSVHLNIIATLDCILAMRFATELGVWGVEGWLVSVLFWGFLFCLVLFVCLLVLYFCIFRYKCVYTQYVFFCFLTCPYLHRNYCSSRENLIYNGG